MSVGSLYHIKAIHESFFSGGFSSVRRLNADRWFSGSGTVAVVMAGRM